MLVVFLILLPIGLFFMRFYFSLAYIILMYLGIMDMHAYFLGLMFLVDIGALIAGYGRD